MPIQDQPQQPQIIPPPQVPPSAAPDASQASTTTPPYAASAAPTPVPATPQPTPEQVEAHHNGLLGQAARFLLGTQSQYSVDPATGKTVETPIAQAPGSLFRAILSGAILGGAVGSQNKTGNGLASAAQGAGAVLQRQDQQDAQRRTQAQQDFKNSQEIDAANQAKIYQQAQIAHMHTADLISNANLDLASQEHLDSLNKIFQTRQDVAVAAGGQQNPILVNGQNINGKQGNAEDFMAAHMDPNQIATQAPQGYDRIHTQQVDYSGLHFEPGVGWSDKDNKPVDMATRTTHNFFDVPQDVFKKQVMVSGKQIEAAAHGTIPAGTLDAAKQYPMTLGDVAALSTKGLTNLHDENDQSIKQQQLKLEARRIANESANIKSEIDSRNLTAIRSGLDATKDKIANLKALRADPNLDPSTASFIDGELKTAERNVNTVESEYYKRLNVNIDRTSTPDATTSPLKQLDPDKDPPTSGPGIPVDRFDDGAFNKTLAFVSTMPKDKALSLVWSSSKLSAVEKLRLKEKIAGPEYADPKDIPQQQDIPQP